MSLASVRLIQIASPTIVLAVAVLSSLPSFGQVVILEEIERPLIESEPFDLVTLDGKNQNAILKIKPPEELELPLPKKGNFVFDFFDGSEDTLQVPYATIVRYETFADLLLVEANEFLDQKQYAQAFRNLLYLYDRDKNDRTILETLRACLFLDAAERLKEKNFELALTIFEDLYQQDPNFRVPGIDDDLVDVVFKCYAGILEKRFENGEFESVRALVAKLQLRYGNRAGRLAKQWDDRFNRKATEVLDQSRRLAKQGNGREAHLLARRADRIAPKRKDILNLQENLLAEFPQIVVGVSQTTALRQSNHLTDWAARRLGRLTQRRLFEISGLGDEGARYEMLNGTFQREDELGLQYSFELDPEKDVFGAPKLTAFQLASRLLGFADPTGDNYSETWAKVLGTVQIESSKRLVVNLRRPFVRPEALLQIPYVESSSPGDQATQDGVYQQTAAESDFTVFALNSMIDRMADRQHPDVIEQLLPSDSDAVDALLAGEVDIVDRIGPADVERLKATDNIQVRAYVVPTLHLLVPKIRGKLNNNYRIRNALSTAISRETIVREAICGGKEIDGCVPITGPFPLGGEDSDQLSYGYDLRIKPLQHNEKLSMVLKRLAEVSAKDTNSPAAAAKKTIGNQNGEQSPDNLDDEIASTSLVLAYPVSTSARASAEQIALAWRAAGFQIDLRELEPGETYPQDDDWDILYMEVFMEEPLVDAIRLFGRRGLVEDITAPVEQSLRNLVTSQTWQGTCLALRNIHRQTVTDFSVIPLFQVKEHYAYRDYVYNLGRQLVHLYQNVDRWEIETAAMAEKRRREEQDDQ